MAYKAVVKANHKAHRNKKFYNPKANTHHFDVNELVYLYTPVLKARQTKSSENVSRGLTR